jgi:N-acetylneuraminate synthase
MGCGASAAAVAHGAVLIEKHFTLRRSDGGVDSSFSLEPEEFLQLRVETERAWQSLGGVRYGTQPAEEKSTAFRRSLYISRDVRAGDVLSAENVRIIRPGFGLPPKFYDVVIGKRAARDAPVGTPISWELIS